jgi:hypothetical protein
VRDKHSAYSVMLSATKKSFMITSISAVVKYKACRKNDLI